MHIDVQSDGIVTLPSGEHDKPVRRESTSVRFIYAHMDNPNNISDKSIFKDRIYAIRGASVSYDGNVRLHAQFVDIPAPDGNNDGGIATILYNLTGIDPDSDRMQDMLSALHVEYVTATNTTTTR